MALLRYFEKKDNLPNPNGPLAKTMPSTSIAAANSEGRAVLESAPPDNKKRGPYAKYTPQQKAIIGKGVSMAWQLQFNTTPRTSQV